jgi:hypothetical protein
MSDAVRIEYMAISSIENAIRNPKLHDIEQIKSSIRRFGFVTPLSKNSATGRLVAGHGRLIALREMLAAGEDRPSRIKQDKAGEWMVPVLCGVEFASEAEAEAYLVADNRLVELSGWDKKVLNDSLTFLAEQEKGLAGVGYSQEELSRMSAEIARQIPTEVGTINPDQEWAGAGMPDYNVVDLRPNRAIILNFKNDDDVAQFAKLIDQPITDKTRSLWFPKDEIASEKDRTWVSDEQ